MLGNSKFFNKIISHQRMKEKKMFSFKAESKNNLLNNRMLNFLKGKNYVNKNLYHT